ETQQKEIDHWTQTNTALERERDTVRKQTAQAEGQLGELQERLEQQRKLQGGEDELQDLRKRIDELDDSIKTINARLAEHRNERRTLRESIDAARREQQAAVKSQRALNEKRAKANERIARLESRCDLLNQMRDQKL